MREQIRQLIEDAQRRATIAADCLEPDRGPAHLGEQAVRFAQIATALHMSQAAPLLAGRFAPAILSSVEASP